VLPLQLQRLRPGKVTVDPQACPPQGLAASSCLTHSQAAPPPPSCKVILQSLRACVGRAATPASAAAARRQGGVVPAIANLHKLRAQVLHRGSGERPPTGLAHRRSRHHQARPRWAISDAAPMLFRSSSSRRASLLDMTAGRPRQVQQRRSQQRSALREHRSPRRKLQSRTRTQM